MFEVTPEPLDKPRQDSIAGMFSSQAWNDLIECVAAKRNEILLTASEDRLMASLYPARQDDSDSKFKLAQELEAWLRKSDELSREASWHTIKIKSNNKTP